MSESFMCHNDMTNGLNSGSGSNPLDSHCLQQWTKVTNHPTFLCEISTLTKPATRFLGSPHTVSTSWLVTFVKS